MNAYCRNCGGVGRLSTVYGVAHCVYCGSSLVTLTMQKIEPPPWWGTVINMERAVQEARKGAR